MHFPWLTPCHQVNSLKNLLHEQFQYFLMNNQVILIWKNFYHRNGVLGTKNLKLHQCTSPKVRAPWPGCPNFQDNSEQDNATSCASSYRRWRCTSQDLRPFKISASIGLLIIIIDQYLTRRRPDMQIYLIKQIAFLILPAITWYVTALLCVPEDSSALP